MQPIVMYIILYGTMVVAALAMIWANQQYNNKGVPWGRPLAGFFGLVAVGMAIFAIIYQFKSDDWRSYGLIEKEMQYAKVSMRVLGKHLATKCAGAKCLVIHPAVGEYNRKRHEALLAALKDGLAGKVTINNMAATGGVEGEMGGPPMPMGEMMLTAEKFDQILNENQDCNLVISLVGLPWDYQNLRLWKKKADEMPRLVLQNPTLTDEALQELIRKEIIVAVLMSNPVGSDPNAPVPSDEMEAFNKRYLLIKADNLDKVMEENGRLFGK